MNANLRRAITLLLVNLVCIGVFFLFLDGTTQVRSSNKKTEIPLSGNHANGKGCGLQDHQKNWMLVSEFMELLGSPSFGKKIKYCMMNQQKTQGKTCTNVEPNLPTLNQGRDLILCLIKSCTKAKNEAAQEQGDAIKCILKNKIKTATELYIEGSNGKNEAKGFFFWFNYFKEVIGSYSGRSPRRNCCKTGIKSCLDRKRYINLTWALLPTIGMLILSIKLQRAYERNYLLNYES